MRTNLGNQAAVHVISRKRLLEAAERHAGLAPPLDVWYRIAKKAQWTSLDVIRKTLPSPDAVGGFTVFNIKGNSFRSTAEVNFKTGRVYIRHVPTHADCSKGVWKV